MPTGRMGAANLSANAYNSIYVVPSGKTANLNINICNRNTVGVLIRLALTTASGTPGTADWIEYNTPLPAYGVLERTGILLSAGQYVIAWSNTTDVNVIVTGLEE